MAVAVSPDGLGSLSLDDKPESLTETVYATILNAIVTRVLQPGQRVTEAAVAERLGVSKTPVREAFVRLKEIGLIEPHGGRGTQIIPPSREALRHAYEMRAALESFTAEMAAVRASERALARIEQTAAASLRHADAGELDGFRSCDRMFHREIAAAAGNPRIPRSIDDAVVLIMTLRQRDMADIDHAVGCGHAHVAIAQLIRAHNGAGAAREMRAHIEHVQEYVMTEWDGRSGPPAEVPPLGRATPTGGDELEGDV